MDLRKVIADVLYPHCPIQRPAPTEAEVLAWADDVAAEIIAEMQRATEDPEPWARCDQCGDPAIQRDPKDFPPRCPRHLQTTYEVVSGVAKPWDQTIGQ
jgi:hypothetical protein